MFLKHEVISNNKLNKKFNLIRLRVKKIGFNFKPGQFVTLKITDSVFRCYSISSSPDILPFWHIFVDITPGGPGTSYIKKLKPGDTIETTLPTGKFVYKKDGSKNIILAGTGCGIAPLLPILQTSLKDNLINKVLLLWGLRFKKDIVLENQLKQITKNNAKFHYKIILSRPEEKWTGNTGHIQKHIVKNTKILPPRETSIYLSGNGEFIKESLSDLKKTRSTPAQIYIEKCY